MFKRCINCNSSVTFGEFYITGFFSSYSKYTCPKCGAKYKAVKQSILFYVLITLPPMIVLMRVDKRGIALLWLLISLVVQPLVNKYKMI